MTTPLDELAGRQSPVHSIPAAAKLAVTAAFALTVVSFPRQAVGRLVPYFIYPALLWIFSDLPLRPILRRLLAALPFCAFIALWEFIFGSVQAGVSLLLKAALCVCSGILFAATTPASALLSFSSPLASRIALTFRYIPLLRSEAGNMYRAYLLRSPRARGVDMRQAGSFAGQLLLRSADRGNRVYSAMACRGWPRVSAARRAFSPASLLFPAVCIPLFVLLRIFNVSSFVGGLLF